MNKAVGLIVGALVLAGIGVIAWYHYGPPSNAPVETATPAVVENAAPAQLPAEPEYRVPAEQRPKGAAGPPMPARADSEERSAARRAGTQSGSTCRSQRAPEHQTKPNNSHKS